MITLYDSERDKLWANIRKLADVSQKIGYWQEAMPQHAEKVAEFKGIVADIEAVLWPKGDRRNGKT